MFKLAISDTIRFQVRLSVNDAGVKKEFSFWLDGRRADMALLKSELETHGESTLASFHAHVCKAQLAGWSDQRIILNEDDTPAAFTPDSLALLLSLPGAASVMHDAYMGALFASAGKEGRAKN